MPLRTLDLVVLFLVVFSVSNHVDADVKLAGQPNLSPDGKTLLFVRGGDIWRVSASGGQAERLTSHPATESQPMVSPNGKHIAFVSNRTGSQQVYVMPAAGGEAQQLTFHSEGY